MIRAGMGTTGMVRTWCALAPLLMLSAWAAPAKTVVGESLARSPARAMPHKILLIPAEIRLHEVSAGGVVERVEAWSRAASDVADAYARELAAGKGVFELVEAPQLDEHDRRTREQHIALYVTVAGSAYFARSSVFAAWKERGNTFDYTLGPGLRDLAEHTGIDAALIISGSDYITTAGRRAAIVMGVVVAAVLGVAVIPQGGTSFVSVGVVDLRTGDLLWFGTDSSQATDFRNAQDLRRMLDGLFQTYPGLAPKAKAGA